jgi:hypothetical protein
MSSQELLKDWQATSERAIEQTKAEARGAMDSYFDLLQRTISSCPTGGTQFGEMVKDYSERNIAATREHLRKLSQAKDLNHGCAPSMQCAHQSSAGSAFARYSTYCRWRDQQRGP